MTVIEHFKALCAIPHCSCDAAQMLAYLREKAEAYGYTLHTDDAGNLLCSHPEAMVTLQAHYDMVCIGKAPSLELYEEAGWLYATESTLGADNGMGMAMMLALMEEGQAVDCLFTSDEETGLVGARELAVPLKTPYLLNLDSEEEGEITVGCAGGVDLNVTLPLTRNLRELECYEAVAEGFPGGHSGVDIDKHLPNAIKELSATLYGLEAMVVSVEGGERRNAVPRRAVATVAFEAPVEDAALRPLGKQRCSVIDRSPLPMLHAFAHGVRDYDTGLGLVRTSINLAEIATSDTAITIKLSARSMIEADLRRIEAETTAYFEAFGASVQSEGFYAPWEPEQEGFIDRVKGAYEAHLGAEVSIGGIHAGLECGIIKTHFPLMQMASVGPTITHPHSTRERVDLGSVERVFAVVKKVLADIGE
ncbi:M20/M25/M40 family metallo-hydrolase [Sulfurimonas sp. HSL-3221]|uniref:M20/M25/M40 family metallo-hydrolase n=1 Tax=Sulfurimonadaceae TaxID=2771471 RepID=UPI001E5339BF|nr:M20/M25/M40 family metallo-hydrolase [Sulfurimonas sp. HSL-3221]UFS61489.1 M20/M25/M40 family metallo-hydrolase [Sulfurimonas sp. HSL-3221]